MVTLPRALLIFFFFSRNTPQAFSHFTYELSQHSLLICDIQGVGDMYTDPQVHTTDGNFFCWENSGKIIKKVEKVEK